MIGVLGVRTAGKEDGERRGNGETGDGSGEVGRQGDGSDLLCAKKVAEERIDATAGAAEQKKMRWLIHG